MSTTEQTRTLPTGTWAADPVHSEIGFSIDYMAGTFRGTFSKFDATVGDGRLQGSAEVASVQVKDPNLEAHLQSPEFFDAERNPQLSFASKDVQYNGNEVTIDGEITIKGQTQPIVFTGTIVDPIADPFGNERFGLKLAGNLDRTRFGVTWNNPLPTGEPALSNEVELVAELQLVKSS
ncbi:MAG: YceI family protein [Actinobacteria bacterium]|nr:YceI family protein [Actinomycetota bacterium]